MQKKMRVGFKQETEITNGKKGRKEGTRMVSKKREENCIKFFFSVLLLLRTYLHQWQCTVTVIHWC